MLRPGVHETGPEGALLATARQDQHRFAHLRRARHHALLVNRGLPERVEQLEADRIAARIGLPGFLGPRLRRPFQRGHRQWQTRPEGDDLVASARCHLRREMVHRLDLAAACQRQ
jgi:ABC-type thiamine transport system ATPase subunit